MATPPDRERVRRMRIRLAALRRHAAAREPDGKSELAVAAGKKSVATREGVRVFGLELALRWWHPSDDGVNGVVNRNGMTAGSNRRALEE